MDRRILLIATGAVTICAAFVVTFSGDFGCIGRHPLSRSTSEAEFNGYMDAICSQAYWKLGAEIEATVLAAMAVGFLTARRVK